MIKIRNPIKNVEKTKRIYFEKTEKYGMIIQIREQMTES